jgi:NAD(P)-dependent dehydrogenase (short-subunit alcohol dehydrogenase family)
MAAAFVLFEVKALLKPSAYMKSLQQKVAVVTGAASGIGRQLGIQLAQAGATVALADVNEERLQETAGMVKKAGGNASVHLVDVSNRQQVYDFAGELAEHHGGVDIVINNAGVTLGLITIDDLTYEEMEWVLGINLWGVIHGTKAFLPHLKKRPEASLVNISSVFGLSGIAMQAPYCIAKFGVRGFTETLRAELLGSNVHVMVVHPGGVKTNIARDARHREMDEENIRQFNSRFEKNARTTAEAAARQIIEGIRQKNPRVLIGKDARWMDRLVRLFPSKAVVTFAKMTKRFDEGGDFF